MAYAFLNGRCRGDRRRAKDGVRLIPVFSETRALKI
jgi:hypothetical protein